MPIGVVLPVAASSRSSERAFYPEWPIHGRNSVGAVSTATCRDAAERPRAGFDRNGRRSPWREPVTAPITGTMEDAAMTKPLDRHAPATTFLTHFFGGGLIDKGECYVV